MGSSRKPAQILSYHYWGKIVLNTTEVEDTIRQVLGESRLPLSLSSILKQTADIMELYPDVPRDEVYSPHRKYEAGQRLCYAHRFFSRFFVVEDPITESAFTARFDNGGITRLAHNDPSDTRYDFSIEGRTSALQDAVTQALAKMPNVDEIEGLYTVRDRLEQVPFHKLSEPRALRQLARLCEDHRSEDRIDELRDSCRRYGLKALYYLTPLDNLGSILRLGVLAKNLAPSGHASFADEGIQSKRHRIPPRQDLALTLHDCVPLFFAPKPPLLYSIQEQQSEVAYIRVNPVVLLGPGVAFSAINARSARLFFTDVADLDKLHWDILKANYWGSDDERQHRTQKLRRQAEAQIPITVPVTRFLDVRVYDEDALQEAEAMASQASVSIPVLCDRSLYC